MHTGRRSDRAGRRPHRAARPGIAPPTERCARLWVSSGPPRGRTPRSYVTCRSERRPLPPGRSFVRGTEAVVRSRVQSRYGTVTDESMRRSARSSSSCRTKAAVPGREGQCLVRGVQAGLAVGDGAVDVPARELVVLAAPFELQQGVHRPAPLARAEPADVLTRVGQADPPPPCPPCRPWPPSPRRRRPSGPVPRPRAAAGRGPSRPRPPGSPPAACGTTCSGRPC